MTPSASTGTATGVQELALAPRHYRGRRAAVHLTMQHPIQRTALSTYPGLRRFAYALLRGDRDRTEQATLERAVSRRHLRRAEGDLCGWLYTIIYSRFWLISVAKSDAAGLIQTEVQELGCWGLKVRKKRRQLHCQWRQ